MAKQLVLELGGTTFSLPLEKVDRSRLYGYVDVEVLDPQGRPCELVTLAGDGQTLIPRGGTASALLSPEGRWMERSRLRPVDPDGRPLEPVPSSFAAPIRLDRQVSIDDYLTYNIRTVYYLPCDDEASTLLEALRAGAIFAFPFSYRGGLGEDTGFLLSGADGGIYLAVGTPARLRFIGLEEEVADEEESGDPEEGDEDDDLDFGMF